MTELSTLWPIQKLIPCAYFVLFVFFIATKKKKDGSIISVGADELMEDVNGMEPMENSCYSVRNEKLLIS